MNNALLTQQEDKECKVNAYLTSQLSIGIQTETSGIQTETSNIFSILYHIKGSGNTFGIIHVMYQEIIQIVILPFSF